MIISDYIGVIDNSNRNGNKIQGTHRPRLKYKQRIQYKKPKDALNKSRNEKPFIYKESQTLRNCKTTTNLGKKMLKSTSDYKIPLKASKRSSPSKFLKLEHSSRKINRSFRASKLSVKSIKDRVARNSLSSKGNFKVIRHFDITDSSQQNASERAHEHLMNDIK